jgi:tetratricopeptide (TPR) repeat protein
MALVWQQLHSLLQQQQRKLSLGRWYQFSRWQFWLPLVCLALLLMLWLGKASVGREDILGGGQTLALLPFENIGADPALDGFIKGLGLSLSHDLALLGEQNQDYWVIPAAEISQLKQPSVAALHRQFAVDLVLQGSMQHLGATRRLSLALVNASNNRVIRSTELDLPLNGWDQAQQQIRTAVLDLLQWQLPPQLNHRLSRGSATDDRAYQHYLTGLSLLYRFDYQENLEKAVQELQTAVQLNPDFKAAWVELNRAYLKLAGLRDFSIWFNLATISSVELYKRYPKDLSVQLVRAEVLTRQTYFDNANVLYIDILGQDPKNVAAISGLARLHEAKGELKLAEEMYLKALTLRDDWYIKSRLANFYYSTSQFEKSLSLFEKLHEKTPANHHVIQTLGAVRFSLGLYDEALDAFFEAVKISPTANNYSNIASVFFYKKMYKEAIANFEKAIYLNKLNYILWGNLGDAYRWSDSKKESLTCYNNAISLIEQRLKVMPNSNKLKIRKLLYLAKSGNIEYVKEKIDEIKNTADHQERIFISQIYEITGQSDKSLEILKELMSEGYTYKSIESEPEFHNLLKKIRLSL